MKKCQTCNKTIFFGGRKEREYIFCSAACLEKRRVQIAADQIPDNIVLEHALNIRNGDCPKCKRRNGPIDIHTSYKVWSLIILTSWNSNPQISCRSCGTKAQIEGFVFSLFCGWWGVPFGIFVTPVQLWKNISGMVSKKNRSEPSDGLLKLTRVNLAVYDMAQRS